MNIKSNLKYLENLLNFWHSDSSIQENVVHWEFCQSVMPKLNSFPEDLDKKIIGGLNQKGIHHLFSHQREAWDAIRLGKHIILTTGTASGKTLCYNLPVINQFLKDHDACALYLFPTKALAQDQENTFRSFMTSIDNQIFSEKWLGLYDGDTSLEKRKAIRKNARLILTNPDMLHQGILPYHTSWARFFSNLQFIIIDEIHSYRGIFGSHVANVIRRLKRIARFYNSSPQFIMTSATIANPAEFAHKMAELEVDLIQQDGSPHGKRNILLFNPPIIQKDLGIRRNSAAEAVRLSNDLLAYDVQTIIFTRSRKSVEFTLKNLQMSYPDRVDSIFSYRSGYLPRDRRYIEKRIREGLAKVVVATNALELGIDIGGLDAILMIGYPGTISAFRQQAGRAGRKDQESLAVLIASANPLDQFLIKHPDYLFSRNVENALINPDNLIILLQHIRCAVYELPFEKDDTFGNLNNKTLSDILEVLKLAGNTHFSSGKHFWVSDQFPAGEVSLRTTGNRTFVLQTEVNGRLQHIGEVDEPSAFWMVHPEAIYLHAGQTYLVTQMNHENTTVKLESVEDEYFTEPRRKTAVSLIKTYRQEDISIGLKSYGEIQVTEQVTGYKKMDFYTHEVISTHQLEMPETQLITTSTWLGIHGEIIEKLRENNLWSDDRNNYGPNWQVQRARALERDRFECQSCGKNEPGINLHIHHKVPFKRFPSYLEANQLTNLISLCSSCHFKAETVVRVRSGLGGLGYVFHHLAPLLLMCSYDDIGVFAEPDATITNGSPCVLIYDQAPAGIGLSENIYQNFDRLLRDALDLVTSCGCSDGCPSCVGAPGEQAIGAKQNTHQLLTLLNE